MQNFVNLIIIHVIFAVLSSPSAAEGQNPANALANSSAVAKPKLKYSPLFEGRGDGVTTCPVTGEKVNKKSLKADLFGRTVYFCCHGCLKAALNNPDKFVKPTQVDQVKSVKAFLSTTDPVESGEYCNE